MVSDRTCIDKYWHAHTFYRLHHNHVSLVSVAALSFLFGGFDGFARINFAISTHVTMSSDFRKERKRLQQ